MSGNPLDSWTWEQINPDHSEHFLFFSYNTWMFFKMCKGISCLVSEPRYVTNISFLSLGSVTVLPTDMVKKRCTGANPSAALDSMKAGTCVSVSSAFFCLWSSIHPSLCWCESSLMGDLWRLRYRSSVSHQWCTHSSCWTQLGLCICKWQDDWISDA